MGKRRKNRRGWLGIVQKDTAVSNVDDLFVFYAVAVESAGEERVIGIYIVSDGQKAVYGAVQQILLEKLGIDYKDAAIRIITPVDPGGVLRYPYAETFKPDVMLEDPSVEAVLAARKADGKLSKRPPDKPLSETTQPTPKKEVVTYKDPRPAKFEIVNEALMSSFVSQVFKYDTAGNRKTGD